MCAERPRTARRRFLMTETVTAGVPAAATTGADPALISKLLELSEEDFAAAVAWVLEELGPAAFAADDHEIVMDEDDPRLEGSRYEAFAFLVPPGADAEPGTRHYLLQEALSER